MEGQLRRFCSRLRWEKTHSFRVGSGNFGECDAVAILPSRKRPPALVRGALEVSRTSSVVSRKRLIRGENVTGWRNRAGAGQLLPTGTHWRAKYHRRMGRYCIQSIEFIASCSFISVRSLFRGKRMSKGKEQRKHSRQSRGERVVVQIMSSAHETLAPGTVVRCSTKDVSSQGIRLQLDHQLPEGLKLELWVEVASQPTKFHLAGEVKWCEALDEGERFMVGLELTEKDAEELDRWQEALQAQEIIELAKLRQA